MPVATSRKAWAETGQIRIRSTVAAVAEIFRRASAVSGARRRIMALSSLVAATTATVLAMG